MSNPDLFPALVALIESISEREWCAGWYMGVEMTLWKEAKGISPLRRLEPDEARALVALSNVMSGWAAWDDEKGDVVYVPIAEWERRTL